LATCSPLSHLEEAALNRFIIAIAFLLLACPRPVAAAGLLPLQVGYSWKYLGAETAVKETQTVVGTKVLLGSPAFVIRYTDNADNEGLENYWTSGPDGDVFLWGFLRNVEGFGWSYDPAIHWADAPLYLGKTWDQHVNVYSTITGEHLESWDITFEVADEVDLTVPAGTFHAFGIGYSVTGVGPHPLVDIALDGAMPSPTDVPPLFWLSEGVGDVQHLSADTLQLSQFDFPTPATRVSWAVVKARYR